MNSIACGSPLRRALLVLASITVAPVGGSNRARFRRTRADLVLTTLEPSTGPATSRDTRLGAHPSSSIGSAEPVVAWRRGDTVRVRTGRMGGGG